MKDVLFFLVGATSQSRLFLNILFDKTAKCSRLYATIAFLIPKHKAF